METRDILDINNNVIGQLTMPENTDESIWQEKLNAYKYVVSIPSQDEILREQVKLAISFGREIITEAAITNIALGITYASNLKDIVDYTLPLQNYLLVGQLPAAIAEIDIKLNEGVPEELAPYVTAEKLATCKAIIQNFLGISPS